MVAVSGAPFFKKRFPRILSYGKRVAFFQNDRHGGRPLVRLRACLHREVQVLSRFTLQPVTDCNCVAARRGGEQQEVNDQSVG